MTDRKIDYSADGIQLEIPPRAPGFQHAGTTWLYYHPGGASSAYSVAALLKDTLLKPTTPNESVFRKYVRCAMICEGASFWGKEMDARWPAHCLKAKEQWAAWLSLLEDE